MAAILRFLEASLLVVMGAFMGTLALSSSYWQFLNPMYSWLTLTSGVVLVIIGFGCLFNVERRPKLSEAAGIGVFLVLAVTSLSLPNSFEAEENVDTSFSQPYPEDAESSEPSMDIGGREYVKINVAELISGEMNGWLEIGSPYVLQGAVVRTEELDRHGYIGVGRLLITCCFADSTGAVSLVKVDSPEAYRAGSWVRVAGVLEEGAPFPGETIHMRGSLMAYRSENVILRAESVEETPVDGVPFMFEIREMPPFAY